MFIKNCREDNSSVIHQKFIHFNYGNVHCISWGGQKKGAAKPIFLYLEFNGPPDKFNLLYPAHNVEETDLLFTFILA